MSEDFPFPAALNVIVWLLATSRHGLGPKYCSVCLCTHICGIPALVPVLSRQYNRSQHENF